MPPLPTPTRGAVRHAVLPLLLACAAACEPGPELLAPEGCPRDSVTVSVVLEPHVEFSWTPSCRVAWLDVLLVDGGAATWIVSGGGANVILPVVRYGRLPDDAIQLRDPMALQPGVQYRVSVFRSVGTPGLPGSIALAGHLTFTR